MQKVKCSVCKKEKDANPVVLAKRIAKYGSIEQIELKWVCRECAKQKEEKIKLEKQEAENK